MQSSSPSNPSVNNQPISFEIESLAKVNDFNIDYKAGIATKEVDGFLLTVSYPAGMQDPEKFDEYLANLGDTQIEQMISAVRQFKTHEKNSRPATYKLNQKTDGSVGFSKEYEKNNTHVVKTRDDYDQKLNDRNITDQTKLERLKGKLNCIDQLISIATPLFASVNNQKADSQGTNPTSQPKSPVVNNSAPKANNETTTSTTTTSSTQTTTTPVTADKNNQKALNNPQPNNTVTSTNTTSTTTTQTAKLDTVDSKHTSTKDFYDDDSDYHSCTSAEESEEESPVNQANEINKVDPSKKLAQKGNEFCVEAQKVFRFDILKLHELKKLARGNHDKNYISYIIAILETVINKNSFKPTKKYVDDFIAAAGVKRGDNALEEMLSKYGYGQNSTFGIIKKFILHDQNINELKFKQETIEQYMIDNGNQIKLIKIDQLKQNITFDMNKTEHVDILANIALDKINAGVDVSAEIDLYGFTDGQLIGNLLLTQVKTGANVAINAFDVLRTTKCLEKTIIEILETMILNCKGDTKNYEGLQSTIGWAIYNADLRNSNELKSMLEKHKFVPNIPEED